LPKHCRRISKEEANIWPDGWSPPPEDDLAPLSNWDADIFNPNNGIGMAAAELNSIAEIASAKPASGAVVSSLSGRGKVEPGKDQP
jgi:hypothetical protein